MADVQVQVADVPLTAPYTYPPKRNRKGLQLIRYKFKQFRKFFTKRRLSVTVEICYSATILLGAITAILGGLVTDDRSKVIFASCNFGLNVLTTFAVIIDVGFLAGKWRAKQVVAEQLMTAVEGIGGLYANIPSKKRDFLYLWHHLTIEQSVKLVICLLGVGFTFVELFYRTKLAHPGDLLHKYCFTITPVLIAVESQIIQVLNYRKIEVRCLVENLGCGAGYRQLQFSHAYPFGDAIHQPRRLRSTAQIETPSQAGQGSSQGSRGGPVGQTSRGRRGRRGLRGGRAGRGPPAAPPPAAQDLLLPAYAPAEDPLPPPPAARAPLPLHSAIIRTAGGRPLAFVTPYTSVSCKLEFDGLRVPFNFMVRNGSHPRDKLIPKVDCIILTIPLVDDCTSLFQLVEDKVFFIRKRSPWIPILLVADSDIIRAEVIAADSELTASVTGNDVEARALAERLKLDLYVRINFRTADGAPFLTSALTLFR